MKAHRRTNEQRFTLYKLPDCQPRALEAYVSFNMQEAIVQYLVNLKNITRAPFGDPCRGTGSPCTEHSRRPVHREPLFRRGSRKGNPVMFLRLMRYLTTASNGAAGTQGACAGRTSESIAF